MSGASVELTRLAEMLDDLEACGVLPCTPSNLGLVTPAALDMAGAIIANLNAYPEEP